MDILQAKLDVIKAGKMLCEKGLIQRTWGNVSCRIDSEHFAVTPSGRAYSSLTPDDIVVVNIKTLKHCGDVKPSSEKGIHAMCYNERPDINFVIHTHQTYASLAGLSGRDINYIPEESISIIGHDVPLASYGLPGSKTLKNAVAAAIKRSSSKAVLMHRHGTVCMGENLEAAFNVAEELEKVCKKLFADRYRELSGKLSDSFDSLCSFVFSELTDDTADKLIDAYNSKREFGVCELTPAAGGETLTVDIASGRPLDSDCAAVYAAKLHSAVYKKRKDINCIIHSNDSAVLSASKTGMTVKPFLDDFAQIVGINLRNAEIDEDNITHSAKKIVKKLKHRDAVLLKHNGALCTGFSEDEAAAVRTVAEKGCRAFAASQVFNKQQEAIKPLEAALMRFVYKTKYSKRK